MASRDMRKLKVPWLVNFLGGAVLLIECGSPPWQPHFSFASTVSSAEYSIEQFDKPVLAAMLGTAVYSASCSGSACRLLRFVASPLNFIEDLTWPGGITMAAELLVPICDNLQPLTAGYLVS